MCNMLRTQYFYLPSIETGTKGFPIYVSSNGKYWILQSPPGDRTGGTPDKLQCSRQVAFTTRPPSYSYMHYIKLYKLLCLFPHSSIDLIFNTTGYPNDIQGFNLKHNMKIKNKKIKMKLTWIVNHLWFIIFVQCELTRLGLKSDNSLPNFFEIALSGKLFYLIWSVCYNIHFL